MELFQWITQILVFILALTMVVFTIRQSVDTHYDIFDVVAIVVAIVILVGSGSILIDVPFTITLQ